MCSTDTQVIEQLMMFGQNSEAYRRLNDIIDEQGDYPEPKILRLRGTCAFHLNKPNEVIRDANLILEYEESDPGEVTEDDIRYAHILLCRGYLMLGHFEDSLHQAEITKDQGLINSCTELLKVYKMMLNFTEYNQIPEATRALDGLLETSPLALELILMRADFAWNAGDFDKYQSLTKDIGDDQVDSLEFFYRRGVSEFCNSNFDNSKNILRKSQRLKSKENKESKESKENKEEKNLEIKKNISTLLSVVELVRKIKEAYTQALNEDNYKKADSKSFEALNKSLRFCPEKSNLIRSIHSVHLTVLRNQGEKDKLLDELDKLVSFSPDCEEFLMERGQLNLEKKEYDAAIFDFQLITTKNQGNRKAIQLLQEAKEGKRLASQIDYYGILGLSKGSSMEEVKSAYKKQVRKWHPDQYNNNPEKKKEAEKMMKKINKAAEVLQDPNKKALIDRGIDPDDPQPQQNVNPFNIFFGNGFNMNGFNMNGQNIKIQFNFAQ